MDPEFSIGLQRQEDHDCLLQRELGLWDLQVVGWASDGSIISPCGTLWDPVGPCNPTMAIKNWWFLDGYGSIPIDTFLVGWTSIYQLFWGSPGVQGFDPSPDDFSSQLSFHLGMTGICHVLPGNGVIHEPPMQFMSSRVNDMGFPLVASSPRPL